MGQQSLLVTCAWLWQLVSHTQQQKANKRGSGGSRVEVGGYESLQMLKCSVSVVQALCAGSGCVCTVTRLPAVIWTFAPPVLQHLSLIVVVLESRAAR